VVVPQGVFAVRWFPWKNGSCRENRVAEFPRHQLSRQHFLNGKRIADSDQVAGAWRTYEFNVSSAVKPGTNVLAVQVWAPTENSLAITFVDWNPAPPDKNMGLWREVYLTASGAVALRHPAVLSRVDSPGNKAAHLTVTALVKNASDHPVHGTVKGRIETSSLRNPWNWRRESRKMWCSRRASIRSSTLAIRDCGGRRRWGLRTCTN